VIAIGFFLLCIVALMAVFDDALFGKGCVPEWYAAIGVISFLLGFLSMVSGFAMVLWRVMP
jgi:hypothetical protein